MASKKKFTIILRGDIRVEIESEFDLVHEFASNIKNLSTFGRGSACDEGFSFRASDVVAVIESSVLVGGGKK